MLKIKPVRVQRSRQTKQISPNGLPIVYCGRGISSKWGNHYIVIPEDNKYYVSNHGFFVAGPYKTKKRATLKAISCFRWRQLPNLRLIYDIKKELGGKNLSCFCALDQPCHVDILLKEANK